MYYMQSMNELKKIMDLEIVSLCSEPFQISMFVLINNNSKPKEKIKNKQLLKPIDVTIFSIL